MKSIENLIQTLTTKTSNRSLEWFENNSIKNNKYGLTYFWTASTDSYFFYLYQKNIGWWYLKYRKNFLVINPKNRDNNDDFISLSKTAMSSHQIDELLELVVKQKNDEFNCVDPHIIDKIINEVKSHQDEERFIRLAAKALHLAKLTPADIKKIDWRDQDLQGYLQKHICFKTLSTTDENLESEDTDWDFLYIDL